MSNWYQKEAHTPHLTRFISVFVPRTWKRAKSNNTRLEITFTKLAIPSPLPQRIKMRYCAHYANEIMYCIFQSVTTPLVYPNFVLSYKPLLKELFNLFLLTFLHPSHLSYVVGVIYCPKRVSSVRVSSIKYMICYHHYIKLKVDLLLKERPYFLFLYQSRAILYTSTTAHLLIQVPFLI